MSSSLVRTAIKNLLATEASSENVIDLIDEFQEVKELLSDNSLSPDSPWLGIEFSANDEVPFSLPATNDQGMYRETGMFQLHVCAIAQLGCGAALLTRGETLRSLLRGRNIDGVIIESVTPMNFSPGATLHFEGGWMSGTFICSYLYNLNL